MAADPLPYRSMIATLAGADGAITDSGGLQEEASVLGVPCSTLRAETEAGDSSGRLERPGSPSSTEVTVKPPSGSSTYWRHGPTTSPLLSRPSGAAGQLRRR
ncbi:UDP-N-acetylglucosamine 2-epimerase [Streptomyces azureus]|uniref:UDP-N-acetylglucosamine 2-epimerase n=1 Tax=Streptomyces azureus TaxID=146537 RepID=UPI0038B55F07